MSVPAARFPGTRAVLTAGFGGLLLLTAFAGVDGIRALRQIQREDDAIREDFLFRTRLLERIRAEVYVSGTYVRDYLLEPEPGKAASHRDNLLKSRADMEDALRQYKSLMNAAEAAPVAALSSDLAAYWRLLDPVFSWSAAERQRAGYLFLRDDVFPRRAEMLGLADQIGAIAEAQLQAGRARVAASYSGARRRLTATIGFTIGLGLLLAMFSMRQILHLEAEAAARYDEISHAREELKQLSARLVDAQEQERRSISRELHDEVGQALTGVLVEMANLSTMLRARPLEPPAARLKLEEKAEEIKQLVEESIRAVRDLALLLRPSMLDDLGLIPAVQWQAREVSKRAGVAVKVAAERVREDLPEEIKTCVYRLVQEALHNCVQHAKARNVRVAIRQEPSRILISVQDDGQGFHPRDERGMGLLGMEERVRHLGGSFAVESEPGHGVVIRAVIPLAEALQADGVGVA